LYKGKRGEMKQLNIKTWEWQWVLMTPPDAKKGVGNKEEGIGRHEPIASKASIEVDSKPLLKHQKNIRA